MVQLFILEIVFICHAEFFLNTVKSQSESPGDFFPHFLLPGYTIFLVLSKDTIKCSETVFFWKTQLLCLSSFVLCSSEQWVAKVKGMCTVHCADCIAGSDGKERPCSRAKAPMCSVTCRVYSPMV